MFTYLRRIALTGPILALLLYQGPTESFTLNRVILACDANPTYIDFWPLVAQAWTRLVGIRPTLALIANDTVAVDESLGDVVRFQPIEGVPTWFYAQVIRLFLPVLFQDDHCLISDIDMLPLNKHYFTNSVAPYADDTFVVYRDGAYGTQDRRYPMCYLAAQGKTFSEVFGISTREEIQALVADWWRRFGYNGTEETLDWNTDELLLYRRLHAWHGYRTRCKRLGHNVGPRIDRSNWTYNRQLLAQGNYYIDSHMVRPYQQYKQQIDELARILGLDI